MRNPLCLTLLAASLFTSLSGASSAAEQRPAGVLNSGISVFAASDNEAGLEVWRSDGTSAGTFRLTDDACGEYCETFTFNTFFAPWMEAGNRAFVLAHDSLEESTLWVTDGSRGGTFPVYQGTRIMTLHPPLWVKSLRLLFFVVHDITLYDYELWCSDGTVEGTRKIRTFVSADTRVGIRELTAFRGRVFFNGQDALHGPALWASDGTEAGTVLIRGFVPDEEGAGPSWLRAVGSRLLFLAPSPVAGEVLWASDGTRAGTRPIYDLQPGELNYATIYDAQVVEGKLFLSTSLQLWVSDGTRAGTRSLGTFREPPVLPQQSFLNGRYYFEARTDDSGAEIWSTNGIRAGTRMLADVCPRECSSVLFPGSLRVVGNRLLFTASRGAQDANLWQSDGTARGTRVIQSTTTPGYQRWGSGPVHMAAGRIFFAASNSPFIVPQLWRTDGTNKGTVRLTNFAENGVTDELIWEIPGAVLFRVVSESGLDELWVSDGTSPGTRRLKTIRTGE